MYALVTLSDSLHGYYEQFRNDNVIYLGFTDNWDIAKKYAKQFRVADDKVYAAEIEDGFYQYLKSNFSTGGELIEFENNTGSKSIIFSEEEIEYMDEIASEDPEGLTLDLSSAIENLMRYKAVPYCAKCIKMLGRIHDALMLDFNDDPDEASNKDKKKAALLDEMNDNESMYHRYKFISMRLQLFEYFTPARKKYADNI